MNFFKKILSSLAIYAVLFGVILLSFLAIAKPNINKGSLPNYGQPTLLSHWSIKSIDTQIVSKYWLNLSKESIQNQVTLLKMLNVNYIAIDTPYDREADLQNWADEIHRQGLHVWFRSHWDNWEGDDSKPASMLPQDYLEQTEKFIEKYPTLFKAGDSFTVAIEPEQVGVGLGKDFRDWDQYKTFLLNEIVYANDGFKKIGLDHKVYTNWLSTNAWVAQNIFTKDLVDKIGIIVIDHYSAQSKTLGAFEDPITYSNSMSNDLDNLYKKWKKPILVGEWGYQIYQDTSEDLQATVINEVISKIKEKPYIIGLNYWAHMGNHSRIIGDENGSKLTYRKAAIILKDVFK